MKKFSKYLSIFLYIFITLILTVKCQKCVHQTSCICELEDDKKINLALLEKGPFLSSSPPDSHLVYYFHPCSNQKPELISNVTAENNNCNSTSVCLLDTVKNTTVNLGKADDAYFTPTSNSDEHGYNLVYQNINNITTVISLVCTKTAESYINIKDLVGHKLMLFSPAACIITEHQQGLSTGSVLVILLFTFTSVYLLGGAAVLHFLRGARGKEMIPNIDFWTDLPALVRDGVLFLQSGCKPLVSPSETYDRI